MELEVKIDGLKEIDDAFAAMADPARVKKIVRKALNKGAKVEQAALRERAPERPDLPSGTALPPGALKADIVIGNTTDGDNLAVIVGPGKYTRHAAGWVEYGHQMVVGGRRKVGKNGNVTGKGRLVKVNGTELTQVPAHPFIRPAYEESASAVTSAIVESLSEDANDPKAKD
jgi:HK97 gp10 family phage protein